MPCTWKDVERCARELADVELTRTHGNEAVKLEGKLIAWRRGHSGDDDTAIFRVELFERDLLLEAAPEIYYLVDHYRDYPAVLARLPRMTKRALRERLKAAIAFQRQKDEQKRAPRRARLRKG